MMMTRRRLAMGKLMAVMMLVSRFRLMVMAEVLDVVDAAGEVLTNDEDEEDQRFSPWTRGRGCPKNSQLVDEDWAGVDDRRGGGEGVCDASEQQ